MPKIYAVSDGTGTTADSVARAATTQFAGVIEVEREPGVRDAAAIDRILVNAAAEDGLVVHTLVSTDLRAHMMRAARARNVPAFDIMGPLLARLSESLQASPSAQPGLAQPFDLENVQRIEALNFTVKHDDGQSIGDLDRAEIVLLGVSRTAKTPVSVFLAYRGWRVANVPLALGVTPPAALFELPPRRVVGLVATPERLSALRRSRVSRLTPLSAGYASIDHIRAELAYAYEVFDRRRDWRVVDVTDMSIEEAAAEVVAVVGAPSSP